MPTPFIGFRYYFGTTPFGEGVAANRPLIAAGIKLDLLAARHFVTGLALEYNHLLEDYPLHSLALGLRLGFAL